MKVTKGKVKRAQKVVLYGPEGIGKSTLAAAFPDPLFIDVEDGTAHLDVARTESPALWVELQALLHAAGKSEYSTIVVDTVDAAERLCIAHLCSTKGWEGIETPGYGKGYTYLAQDFARFLDGLDGLARQGKNVVLCAHSRIAKFEQPDEAGAYDRYEMKLEKKTAPLVKEWCDALLFLNHETVVEVVGADRNGNGGKAKARGGRRVMFVEHHPCWDAKNRWGLTGKHPVDFSVIAPFVPGAGEAAAEPRQPEPPALDGLRALVDASRFTMDDVRAIVEAKGFYPPGTPVEEYGEEFVRSKLVGSWESLERGMAQMELKRMSDAAPFVGGRED